MAIAVTLGGVTYSVPEPGDTNYAQQLTNYLVALATAFPQVAGQVGFSALTSTTANPATAGQVRLAAADVIDWRNQANGANLPLGINSNNNLVFNSTQLDGQTYASYFTCSTSCSTGVATICNFQTVESDSESCVNTGASWKFTVPSGKAGVYRVSAFVTTSSVAPAANSQLTLKLYKNGSAIKQIAQVFFTGGTGWFPGVGGSIDVSLAAADFIDVRLLQNLTATLALNGANAENWITIKRLV